MSQRTPVSILIVNEHAEETKLATIGFRGFFPDCRIDIAYSPDDARALAATQTQQWAILLIDEGCLAGNNANLIEDLKRHALHAGVLLQCDHSDSASAIRAMQAGADFFLAKQSPAFLTELLFCAREAMDKRALQIAVEHEAVRHRQFLETLSDVFYELDGDGCFLAVGPAIAPLLGYTPDELIGISYSKIFSLEQQAAARFRFNERRSGARSARNLMLTFQRKCAAGAAEMEVTAEVSARGLYDSHRQFIGTVGLIRDTASIRQQEALLHQLQQQSPRAEELRDLTQRVAALSQSVQRPLAALLTEAQQLLHAVRDTRLDERIQQLVDQAAGASDAGNQLARTLESASIAGTEETINDLIREVVASLAQDDPGSDRIITALSPHLPGYAGDRTKTLEFIRLLLGYAQKYLGTVGRGHQLVIKTSGVGLADLGDTPPLFPLAPPDEVEIELSESDFESRRTLPSQAQRDSVDLLELYRRIDSLGGTLDMSAPAGGPLRMIVRLPTVPRKTLKPLPSPITVAQPTPGLEETAPPSPPTAPATSAQVPAQDRRAYPRLSTTLPAHLSLDSTTWDGTISNLSLGGACITLPADFPPIARQDVYVVLRTAVGILELNGTAYTRSSLTNQTQSGLPVTRVIIVFKTPPPTETAILTSMIEAAREQSVAFSLDVLLTARSAGASTSETLQPQDLSDYDRRESVRVTLTLPIRLETDQLREPANRLVAKTLNISRDGACLLVKASPAHLQGLVTLHFAPARTASHPGPHEPGTPDSALPAEVLWAVPDPTAPSEYRPNDSAPAARIGLRFASLTPFAERELVRLVRQHIISGRPSIPTDDQSVVVSIRRECRNHRGQAIAITDDHVRQPIAPETPILIIAPGFGQTASDYSAFSYYIAQHRLRVLRYDHTNHIGLSEGELQNTTVRGMQTDLAKVIEFVQHTWPTAPIVILASDMSARAALRMAAHTRPLDLLLLVNPVLDVSAQLMTVHGHDLISDYQFGLRRGIANLLGLNINVDQFVGDLIAGRVEDLASTLDDIRVLRSPLCLITSPVSASSPLVPADLPHTFMTAIDTRTRMLSILTPLSAQDLPTQGTQPASFRQVLDQIASVLALSLPPVELRPASRQDLKRQQQLEREQMRLHHNLSQISREALALAHSQQLPQLANVHVYRKLLDDLYAFLGPINQGMTVVDAGIGQSDLTRALLVNHTYRTRQRGLLPNQPPLLVGVRRSSETIQQAKHNVLVLLRELVSGTSSGIATIPSLTLGWVQGDWTKPLPFRSESIHRIVSNMSLPFVRSPRETIQEWCRVLPPGGRAVFTTFHPHTDLSALYRHHLRLANQDEFATQAQQVLHYLGRLREALCHGILHAFDQSTLAALLRELGITSFRISPVLSGQVFAVVVEKSISSGSL
jgi:PAS domain S-box-containing protein